MRVGEGRKDAALEDGEVDGPSKSKEVSEEFGEELLLGSSVAIEEGIADHGREGGELRVRLFVGVAFSGGEGAQFECVVCEL